MDILKEIIKRRSVRRFKDKIIPKPVISKILEAGRWAPSGLNNQPWRFLVIEEEPLRKSLSVFTHYGKVIKNAPLAIAVFLDKRSSYHLFKDYMAMGACIENMLLEASSLGVGSCWLGEILKNKDGVRRHLGVSDDFELSAVLVFGYAKAGGKRPSRKPVDKLLLRKA